MNIKVPFFHIPPPLTPPGSVHSLGLLFRPDKQGFFFVYGNYCLRIVSNVSRLSMRSRAGGRGDVMGGNLGQLSEYILLQLKGTSVTVQMEVL